jgi:hypothetical protein
LKFGYGRAKAILYFQNVLFILVRLSGPKESFQTVFLAARHDMDVEVWHALTDTVVNGNEAPFSPQALLNRVCQKLSVSEKRADETAGKVRQSLEMFSGGQQAMAGEKGPAVQKGKRELVFQHSMRWLLPSNNLAESAILSIHRTLRNASCVL